MMYLRLAHLSQVKAETRTGLNLSQEQKTEEVESESGPRPEHIESESRLRPEEDRT